MHANNFQKTEELRAQVEKQKEIISMIHLQGFLVHFTFMYIYFIFCGTQAHIFMPLIALKQPLIFLELLILFLLYYFQLFCYPRFQKVSFL